MKFIEALERYINEAPSSIDKVPCESKSTERMRGWLMRDALNHHIGWVPDSGRITYIDHNSTQEYIID